MSSLLKKIEDKYINKSVADENFRKLPEIKIGMTVRVNYRIIEGDKERVQPYEGVVIARHFGNSNNNATFTVRRVNQGFGVERVFPLHSPRIESIKVVKEAVVRRAKLYYLRELVGKKARLKEKLYVKS